MKSAKVSAYEAPRIKTVSAAALLEMIGPVQGYAVGIGSPHGDLTNMMGVGGRPGTTGFGN